MNRWENLYIIVYWNGAGTEASLVYSNGCRVESLCGAEKSRVADYMQRLASHGWEKFGGERTQGSVLETFYFQRPLEEAEQRASHNTPALPVPGFVDHHF